MKTVKYICEKIIPIDDHVIDGMYIRTCFAEKGDVLVGGTHKKDGIGILEKGTLEVVEGSSRYTIEAPFRMKTNKGSQKSVLALNDVIYTSIHRVDAESPQEAEKETIEEVPQITRIRDSYNKYLLDTDSTEDQVQLEMKEAKTFIENSENFYIKESPIHGLGCFARKYIQNGDLIAISLYNNVKTATGRYVNHSDLPNAKQIELEDGDIGLIAMVDIPENNEIFVNYNECMRTKHLEHKEIEECQQ